MTDVDAGKTSGPPAPVGPDDPIERVEGYRTDDGLVLYDAQNPLAWITSTTSASLEGAR
ncbi:MAG: hypothetical protein ABEJ77_00375 [Halanaeroarchaeum sp.]